jgi:hypothetical protein
VRVSFNAVQAQPVSVVAGLSGGTLGAFHAANGFTIVIIQPGTGSAEEMLHAKKQQEGSFTWILRGVGMVVMLIGFALIGRPISMVLGFLPFLEGIAETGVFLVALMLTVPVTLLIIAVAWIAHRPLLGVALIAGAVAAFVLLRKLLRKPAANATVAPG